MAQKEKVQRLKGVSIDRPIVYGNLAIPLGKKAEEGKTHKWICYVRGAYNEDISYFVKKVIFLLHPSFNNPKRVVERFPFEIQECGWGEFEITIKVYFQDPIEKCLDLFHPLKLYPLPNDPPKQVVVSENYEEIVFNQPREEFYKILTDHNPTTMPPKMTKYSEYYTQFNEQIELKKVQDAQKKIKREIQAIKEKYEKMETESTSTGTDISKLDTPSELVLEEEEEEGEGKVDNPLEDSLDSLEWTAT